MRPIYEVRRLTDLARALAFRRELRKAEQLTRDQLEALQSLRLQALLRKARTASPFYKELLGSFSATPALGDLPAISKQTIVDNFEGVATDPRLRYAEIVAHVKGLTRDEYYLGQYRVSRTSGSTGVRGAIAYNRREWAISAALLMRRNAMAGVHPSLLRRHRRRALAISSTRPNAIRSRWALTLRNPLQATKLISFIQPMAEIVSQVQEFRPDVLSGDATSLFLLAREQIESRLAIAPEVIWSTSEVLSPAMRQTIIDAWGVAPFDTYAASETGVLGSPCELQTGIHLYEDMFILEVVDKDGRAVGPGETGSNLLVTNLYNYTLPQIRYVLSDHLTLAPDPCPCGRPFRLVAAVSGREEEVFYLDGQDGRKLPIAPIHMRRIPQYSEGVHLAQVIVEEDHLLVEVTLNADAESADAIANTSDYLTRTLEVLGAVVPRMDIRVVSGIPRDRTSGKMLVVTTRARRGAS